ncbi:uncharacterized protein AKAME5_002942300 [Lates japonicus]|uniref:Uncharacterized protein n=1 Tax=Lates japonicus TaxID=270547 RepID=A0AAD3N8C3_LATJO|nr:uncharacterized protein AKAME5_002942300 [Lates japonicus]
MSVTFSGWEAVDDGASFPSVKLGPSQTPQNRGIVYTLNHVTSVARKMLIIANGFKPSTGGMLGPGVYRIDKDNHPMQLTWHSHGYDTAWVPPKCGMKSVPSGLEEDCVFDPKRVKVVGIAKAPNTNVEKELKQLLGKKSKEGRGGGTVDVCSLCKRKTQKGSLHIKQQCWECGKNICILMSKHYCPSKP